MVVTALIVIRRLQPRQLKFLTGEVSTFAYSFLHHIVHLKSLSSYLIASKIDYLFAKFWHIFFQVSPIKPIKSNLCHQDDRADTKTRLLFWVWYDTQIGKEKI